MRNKRLNEQNTNKGITLIALVITIIVMLILVAVTITMAVNGGLFEYAQNAGTQTNGAIANEQLLANGGVTIGDQYYNSIDEFINGNTPTTLTLGTVYKDDMIGQPITYSANDENDWIIFGKDKSGNILITTKLPIDEAFNLYGSAEKWLTYEDDLHTACAGYGGTIQGQNVTSRSITMDDINYVAGFTKPTFETFTFGATHGYDWDEEEWTTKEVNYYYPKTGGYYGWQHPADVSTTFANDWYGYYCNWDDGKYYYYGADIGGDEIPASERNIKTENLKYIWGGNTEETMYNEYLVASRSVYVYSDYADFLVAYVGGCGVNANDFNLCYANASGGYVSGRWRDWIFRCSSRRSSTIYSPSGRTGRWNL